jgi:hypothetical protein
VGLFGSGQAKLGEMAAQQGVTQELAAMMSEEHITLQDGAEESRANFVAFSLQWVPALSPRRFPLAMRKLH